jgi:transposase
MLAAATRRFVRTVRVSLSTVGRTKRRFAEGNLERALSDEPRPGAERKLTGKEEALLVATACAKPPVGRKRWTLTLLTDRMVKLTDHDSLSGETVRRRLAENDLKPWHRGWRNVKITDRRAAVDYAHCMRELVDVHYPDAACIRVVQDNLSIHTAGALYQAFALAEARRILRHLELHYTPKHASWLNMVKCEISLLQRQCLGRRIDDPKKLQKEIVAWQRQRNKTRDRIKWMFTTDKARAKFGCAYPAAAKESKPL